MRYSDEILFAMKCCRIGFPEFEMLQDWMMKRFGDFFLLPLDAIWKGIEAANMKMLIVDPV